MQKFLGHTDQVVQVAFSLDGRYALTGSTDQTARLWDLQSGQVIRQFVGHTSALLFAGFSADGRYVLTGDTQAAYIWRTALEDIIAFTCTQLSRDFTLDERQLYIITDAAPTCPEFSERTVAAEPTWTPAPVSTLVLAPLAQPTAEVIEIVFLTDAANIQFGVPMQDVYIDDGDGMIMRPQDLSAETLAQPLYRATTLIEPDFLEEPFEVGPFEKGEPLGLTLAEWLDATGRGTYTILGNRAVLDLTFENLIPNGVYTLWCTEIHVPPDTKIIDHPCGAPDGSENTVIADAQGRGAIRLEMDVLPPSTEEVIISLGFAYHSDGLTHGAHPGEFGYNLHVQLFYEFPQADDE